MKSNIKFFFIYLLLFLSSCSYSDKKNTVDTLNIFPTDSLSVFMGLPMFAEYYDDKLFVMDLFGSDGFIKVIDLNSDSLMFSFAVKGNGPNEYLNVSSIDIYSDDNSDAIVGIYDLMGRTYRTYSYSNLCTLQHQAQPMLTKNFTDKRYSSIIRLDSMYLATDLNGEKRFMVYDEFLSNGQSVCDYRPKPSGAFPDELHARLHNGSTFVSPDRKTIGNTIFLAPILSVFTTEKQNIRSAWEYVIKEMDYTVRGDNYTLKTPKGYISGAFSNKYVYALFCGKEENEGDYADELDVFSYDGKLFKKYRLAQPAFGICVNESKNELYALVHEPEPKIYIYHLNDF
jgi:hypothetical protein